MPNPLARLVAAIRGRGDSEVVELDAVIRDVQKLIAAGTDTNGTRAGMLTGLLDTGHARLVSEPEDTVCRHGGYLLGHLFRWLIERGLLERRRFSDPAFQDMVAGYTTCLADSAGQRCLAKADKPMSAHLYVTMRCEEKWRRPVTWADEQMLFGWLLEQAGVPSTPALGERLQRQRRRRHARLGFTDAG